MSGGGPGGVGEAATQLEAYFLRQVLSAMPKGAMFGDGAAASTLHGMFTEALADAVAGSGDLGLADEIRASLEDAEPPALSQPFASQGHEDVVDQISAARARTITSSIESTDNGVGP